MSVLDPHPQRTIRPKTDMPAGAPADRIANKRSNGFAVVVNREQHQRVGKLQRDPKKCIGNDNTCGGFKAKGTDYCMGHLRALEADSES